LKVSALLKNETWFLPVCRTASYGNPQNPSFLTILRSVVKFLAQEIEGAQINWSEISSDLLKSEARRAYDLQQTGFIRDIHFRADNNSAVIELECDSLDQAKEITDSLPLVKKGYIQFEIVQLIPYPGFKRLFSE
jgi:hypothetical protein